MSERDPELSGQFDPLIPRKRRYCPPTTQNGVKICKNTIWKYKTVYSAQSSPGKSLLSYTTYNTQIKKLKFILILIHKKIVNDDSNHI
jgi:hypothetical protein